MKRLSKFILGFTSILIFSSGCVSSYDPDNPFDPRFYECSFPADITVSPYGILIGWDNIPIPGYPSDAHPNYTIWRWEIDSPQMPQKITAGFNGNFNPTGPFCGQYHVCYLDDTVEEGAVYGYYVVAEVPDTGERFCISEYLEERFQQGGGPGGGGSSLFSSCGSLTLDSNPVQIYEMPDGKIVIEREDNTVQFLVGELSSPVTDIVLSPFFPYSCTYFATVPVEWNDDSIFEVGGLCDNKLFIMDATGNFIIPGIDLRLTPSAIMSWINFGSKAYASLFKFAIIGDDISSPAARFLTVDFSPPDTTPVFYHNITEPAYQPRGFLFYLESGGNPFIGVLTTANELKACDFFNSSGCTFSIPISSLPIGPLSFVNDVAVGNIDGGADINDVAILANGNIYVLLNFDTGPNLYTLPATNAYRLAVIDVDGDGYDDIIAGGAGGLMIYGSLEQMIDSSPVDDFSVVELTGDSFLEIVALRGGSTITTFALNTEYFAPVPELSTSITTYITYDKLFITDSDRDGVLEFIVADLVNRTLTCLKLDRSVSFSPSWRMRGGNPFNMRVHEW